MDAREAEAFLATSWGSAAGDRERRFFSEMVRFHCSGDEPTRTSSSPSPSPLPSPSTSPSPSPSTSASALPQPTRDPGPSPGPNQVRFYCSGEVLALLLEKDGAIGAWRTLLGPGDPAVARGYTDRFGRVHRAKAPHSVRALYGTNKQANAAHGADSPEAARREISLIFGAEFVEPQEPPEAAEEKAAV